MAKNKRATIPKSLVDTFVRVWNEHNKDRRVQRYYINSGWCYQFAIVVKKALGTEVDIYTDTDGGHCWVKIGNYFYDSDHLYGVKNDLSMSYSGEEPEGPVSIRAVQTIWRSANSGPVQLHTINKVVKEWKQLYSRT